MSSFPQRRLPPFLSISSLPIHPATASHSTPANTSARPSLPHPLRTTRSRSSRSSGALLAGGQVSAVARAAARCPSSLFAAGLFHPSPSAVPPRRTSLDGWQRRGGAPRRLGLQPLPTRAAARSCCRRPRSRAPAAGHNSVLLMPTISSSSCCRRRRGCLGQIGGQLLRAARSPVKEYLILLCQPLSS